MHLYCKQYNFIKISFKSKRTFPPSALYNILLIYCYSIVYGILGFGQMSWNHRDDDNDVDNDDDDNDDFFYGRGGGMRLSMKIPFYMDRQCPSPVKRRPTDLTFSFRLLGDGSVTV